MSCWDASCWMRELLGGCRAEEIVVKLRELGFTIFDRVEFQFRIEIKTLRLAARPPPCTAAPSSPRRAHLRTLDARLAVRLPRERRREMLQQAQEVAPTSGALAALCAADDGRRLSRFVSRGPACVALLAAHCRLLDAPLGRRCATLAREMLRPGTPCVAREFFVWRSPARRRSGDALASLRRCRDGWSDFF
ncbi:hypothetical protein F511_35053 [Dorcoceras hygrometricum]|uniref:Uncharacterized protein n=1 Tax=Dorcoceras hygrometricum TaxID=472368 RepID=A0A2Z7CSD7_9LAMI|nr:hypothetical protein F511_35053 [Dorcoceras hygrometricum]